MKETKRNSEDAVKEMFNLGFRMDTLGKSGSSNKENETKGAEPEKERILCPLCGEELVMKNISGKGKMWAHQKKGRCTATYKNRLEIETAAKAKENSKSKKEPEKTKKSAPEKPVCEIVEEAEIFTWENEAEENFGPVNMNNNEESRIEHDIKEGTHNEETDASMQIQQPSSQTEAVPERKSRMKRISREDAIKLHEKMKQREQKETEVIKAEEKAHTGKLAEKPAGKKPEKSGKKEEISDKTEILKKPAFMFGYPSLINIETGEVIELDKPSYIIGRKEGDYLIDKTVISKKHAQFITKNDKCYVKDLDSTNGTKINGYAIPPETEVEVKNGQTVCFADEEFEFTYER